MLMLVVQEFERVVLQEYRVFIPGYARQRARVSSGEVLEAEDTDMISRLAPLTVKIKMDDMRGRQSISSLYTAGCSTGHHGPDKN